MKTSKMIPRNIKIKCDFYVPDKNSIESKTRQSFENDILPVIPSRDFTNLHVTHSHLRCAREWRGKKERKKENKKDGEKRVKRMVTREIKPVDQSRTIYL